MTVPVGSDGHVNIDALAAQMLGLSDNEQVEEQDDDTNEHRAGHPAWQAILDKIPAEYHDAVMPTLQGWDAGVSRRFQKIHDEYAPYRDLIEDYDLNAVQEALGVYNALNNNPAETWETIGRVYGLSPQSSQASSDEESDMDFDDLPDSIRERLSKIDQHDNVLEYMSQFVLDSQAANEQAQEDAALEQVLDELREEYGDYDEDYVVGLIAAGVDPEDAVGRFQQFAERYGYAEESEETGNNYNPRVLSSGGGIPNMGEIDVNSLSSQDTQSLIAEILRLSQDS